MELMIKQDDSNGQTPIPDVEYFEVRDDPDKDGLGIYCEFEDGHTKTFENAVLGAGAGS